MNVLRQIEKRSYLATKDQVARMARLSFESNVAVRESDATYGRILIAAVQNELNGGPRLRASRKVSVHETGEVLEAFERIHTEYYEIVLEAVTTADVADKPTLKKADKSKRALERNKRSNFARTWASLIRNFIKADGDVLGLVVPTMTKSALRQYITAKRPQPTRDERIERTVQSMVQRIEALNEEDKAFGAEVAQKLLLQLAQMPACAKYTTSPKKAQARGMPLRIDEGLFIPVLPSPGEGEAPTLQ